jgi:hypothetical protein
MENNEDQEVVVDDTVESEETEVEETEVQPEGEAETQEEEVKKTEEAELFELPDGRKVDGSTLAKEWKENFYPEFTRRSQKLKELESAKQEVKSDSQEGKSPWDDPNWEPQTWQEVLDAAERKVTEKAVAEKAAAEQAKKSVNDWVESQVAEIRKEEPKLNEDALFSHAIKYGFYDIKSAYQNMKDMNLAVKHTEKKVVDKLKARAQSSSPSGDGSSLSDSFTYEQMQAELNESPLEALRRLKSK